MKPVEGTILTVVRVAAEAAERSGGRGATLGGGARGGPPGRRAGARGDTGAARGAARGRGGRRRGRRLPAVARRVPSTSSRAGRCPRHAARRTMSAAMPAPASTAGDHGGDLTLRGHVLPRRARRARSTTSRRRGPRSATRSSSSAATDSGTATCTPTTSAARSRAAIDSRPAAPDPGHRSARAGRRGATSAARPLMADAAAPGPPVRPRWSRSAPVPACAPVSPVRCAGGRGGRPDDEPLDRGAARRGRTGCPSDDGGRPAEQQEHRAGGGTGRRR